jgi:hypothetical protein
MRAFGSSDYPFTVSPPGEQVRATSTSGPLRFRTQEAGVAPVDRRIARRRFATTSLVASVTCSRSITARQDIAHAPYEFTEILVNNELTAAAVSRSVFDRCCNDQIIRSHEFGRKLPVWVDEYYTASGIAARQPVDGCRT